MSHVRSIKNSMKKNISKSKLIEDSLCKSKTAKKRNKKKETSSSIPLQGKKSGSLTIEAALVLPLFLWFILMLFYFFFLIDIQGDITMAMSDVAKELGEYQYCEEEYLNCFSSQFVMDSITEELGQDRLKKSCIKNGEEGLHCTLKTKNSNVDIIVKYYLSIPVPIFDHIESPIVQRSFVHGWTGFDRFESENIQETMVYVAEGGEVYHKYRSCTYLDLSIRSVDSKNISKSRNKNGEKYYCCEKCGKKNGGNVVYITDWGNKYHTSLSCSGLKRTVRTIPLSKVGKRRKCSKCW